MAKLRGGTRTASGVISTYSKVFLTAFIINTECLVGRSIKSIMNCAESDCAAIKKDHKENTIAYECYERANKKNRDKKIAREKVCLKYRHQQ